MRELQSTDGSSVRYIRSKIYDGVADHYTIEGVVYHNKTHIFETPTYAYPIQAGLDMSDSNPEGKIYVYATSYGAIVFDRCLKCACCVNGICRPAGECTTAADKAGIIIGILVGLIVLVLLLLLIYKRTLKRK